MNTKLHNLLFHFFLVAIFTLVGIFIEGIATAQSRNIIFDTEVIRKRGFDPNIATQFQKDSRFPQGFARVDLVLNGHPHGQVTAKFGAEGNLCLTTSLLREAGLRVPGKLPLDTFRDCIKPSGLWPRNEITLHPDTNTLEILVPESAVADQTDYTDWEHGGTAGMLNYNGQYLVSQASDSRFSFWQMQTETGFNSNDWIVRSSQDWTHSDDTLRFRHHSLWAERTFYNLKSRFRTGLFTLSGSTLGVGRILGAQLTPENALYKNSGVAVVTGIAGTPSVVEIRQSGVLLNSTTVPAGPFTLSNFSLLNTHTDLQVNLAGSDGVRQEYSVPAAAYMAGGHRVTPGMAWGIGRLEQEDYRQHPMIMTFSRGWQVFPRLGIQTDVLYSPHYQSTGITSDLPFGGQVFSFSSILMTAGSHHGAMSSLSVSRTLAENVSLNLNGALRNSGFRDFSETMVSDEGRTRNRLQYGSAVSWYHALAGSFSLSWTRSENRGGRHSDYAQLGWTRKVGKGYLSVTASRNEGSINHRREDMLYASWQVPLGEATSISSWINNRGKDTRYGTRLTRRETRDTSWNVSVDHSRNDGASSLSVGINQLTSWSQLSGNASYDSEQYRSLSLQGSGAAILHKSGLIFSPYRIGDTFAVVQAGQQEGIRIDTTSGVVRTDRDGYAVVPSMAAWNKSALQIDSVSLKNNIDVINGVEEIAVARGAVREVNFRIVSTRRVLVNARGGAGQPLPGRMGVYDDLNKFITVTGDDGTLFIPDAKPGMKLIVSLPEGRQCMMALTELPSRIQPDAGLYETTEAICRPVQSAGNDD